MDFSSLAEIFRTVSKNRYAIIVNALREIEASRESEVRLKENPSVRDLPRQCLSPRHSLRSIPLFPHWVSSARSVRRKRISVFSLRPAAHESGARRRGSAPLFSFSPLPPWRCSSLYLSNSTPDRGVVLRSPSVPHTALSPHLHIVGCAHFAPPLYGQFPSPLRRVLEIIKSSLS